MEEARAFESDNIDVIDMKWHMGTVVVVIIC